MKTIQIFAGLAGALLLSGCFIDIDDDDGITIGCLNADGPYVSRSLALPEFTGIRNATSAEVFLQQGSEQEVVVEGKEDVIGEIERDINGDGVWHIEFDRCVRDVDELTFFITMPTIRSLRIDGAGDLKGENLFLVEDLELEIDGSGDLDIALEADDLNADMDGSGDILLEGIADKALYRMDGSGDVRAYGLTTQAADVDIDGSGNVWVRVENFLKVTIDGSGDVYYKGEPELEVEIRGSGDVIDDN